MITTVYESMFFVVLLTTPPTGFRFTLTPKLKIWVPLGLYRGILSRKPPRWGFLFVSSIRELDGVGGRFFPQSCGIDYPSPTSSFPGSPSADEFPSVAFPCSSYSSIFDLNCSASASRLSRLIRSSS
jgi:hypothetical protein